MNKDIMYKKLECFIKEIENINWLIHAGEESDKYAVVLSFTEAWDEWNDKMLEVWGKESHNIEKFAIDSIGDDMIDLIFERVAQETGPKIAEGLVKFQDRLKKMGLDSDAYGLDYEIMDFIKRDISWACIEVVIEQKGFFSRVLKILSEGRWPCAWDGSHPLGRFVVI
ncbi:hypothetical protein [Clostridium tagluense]|uniref:Uncharacterized protein n=1 Tax=Clostridium tagluense TaxID=360422 RepID=A0A401UKQ9_9CLOT|nr:hypothetical protein [Clostridium tagluense]GCD10052.1 hypothetical protein Ctaglu_16750 [Clostridium tagluense]